MISRWQPGSIQGWPGLLRHEQTISAVSAEALGRAPEHVTRNHDRLINQHHVLQPAERGTVEFSVPGLAGLVISNVDHLPAAAKRTNQ